MSVVGSFFCVLGASLVNRYSSRDATLADKVGVENGEALWFNGNTALTNV